MNRIITISICLLMTMKAFSMDSDTNLKTDEDPHYCQENEHLVSIIVYDIASAKLSSQSSDFQKSYEHSRKALTAATLLNQDYEE